jgi:hypothetical protein
MKRTLIILLLLIVFFKFPSTAQSDATKKETADFIKGKFDLPKIVLTRDYEDFQDDLAGNTFRFSDVSISIIDCSCEISYTQEYGSEPPEKLAYQFSFSDLAASAATVEKPTGKVRYSAFSDYDKLLSYLVINTFNGQKLIKRTYRGKVNHYESMNFMWGFDSNELQRVKNAVNHLIKLCGGKEEKF